MSDPQIARYGSQFAERLSVALSKTARDERLYRQAHYDPLTALAEPPAVPRPARAGARQHARRV